MQDRVSQIKMESGALRYAMYDDGQVFQGNVFLELNDDPSVVGTPLSKNTLLNDNTASALGANDLDAATVNEAIRACVPWRLVASYTTAGVITPYTVPTWAKEIGIFIIGGGASGGARAGGSTASIKPGGSGQCNWYQFTVSGGESITGTVGAGGAEIIRANGAASDTGNNGADTTATLNGKTITANGGTAGGSTTGLPAVSTRCLAVNPFDNRKCLLDSQEYNQASGEDDYGNSGSASVYNPSGSATATVGTAYGCGGGYAYSEYTSTAKSAAGNTGAILIYAR